MTIILILEFAFALGALIFVHEFGHFIAMKLFHIEVEEFGFGYPPRAAKLFTAGGTLFSLNWIPFGGFTKPKGENDPSVPGSLAAANPWQRIAIYLAGPIMNLLTAVVLFILIYGFVGHLPDRSRIQLVEIVPNTPAAQAGLQSGDILLSVGGVKANSLDNIQKVIRSNLGKPLNFTYQRDGANHEVTITPLANPGNSPAVGISMSYPLKPFTVWDAIPESIRSIGDYIKQLISVIGQIFSGRGNNPDARLVGLKGMYDMYVWSVQSSTPLGIPKIVNALAFIVSVSMSLALFNLLPIPAMDGGRIAFVLPEILIRRRIPPKYEMVVNFVSFALILLLMLYINLQDFINPISTPHP